MPRDRIVQLVALAVLAVSALTSGVMLPNLVEQSDRNALRYTDISVEGAPPFVALGTMMGALRGLVVDYLWIKVHIMKERGLYYEVMADSELITRLQPRFAAVWSFLGHNMAYNISVATHTERERWEWVIAGIRLVRNQGLRYNPNDLVLHKELAFWFSHKIAGYADDAHLYYKTEFCREWHYLLGEPPDDTQEREDWIRQIAEAPVSLQEAEQRTPGVAGLVEALTRVHEANGRVLKLDRDFLFAYAEWKAVREQSEAARIIGRVDQLREQAPFFRAFDELAGDSQYAEAWATLVRYTRRSVLLDEYNMDPQLMYEYTRDLGPIDWRNAEAHALYWSRRGAALAERRVLNEDDIYKVLNNDRLQLQAMQGLARWGRMYFDPFSQELPARFPDPRWIDTIDREFVRVYRKHYNTRGGGPESFIGFFRNFLSSAVREWYRAGERERAQALMDRLDELFGSGQGGGIAPDPTFSLPLDVFVRNETLGEYENQPHIAPSEVAASLRYGYVEGIGRDRPEVYEEVIQFANMVTTFFKENETNDYMNKFSRGRMTELIGLLEQSRLIVFAQVMIDRSIPLAHRMTMWSNADKYDQELRLFAYDRIRPQLERELSTSIIGQRYTIDQVLPAPPGLEAYRIQAAELQRRLQEQQQQAPERRDPTAPGG